MKLVRIVTTDQLAVFETKFNEDIVIEPESQIALSNASFDTVFKTLVIDGGNDQLNYKIRAADEKTITLRHGEYTSSSADTEDLMLQLQNGFNEGLALAGGEIGTSFRVNNSDIAHPSQGKVQFICKRLSNKTGILDFGFLGDAVMSKTFNDTKRAVFNNSGAAIADDSCKIVSVYPLAEGCSIVRAKIRQLADNSSSDNGFKMFLLDKEMDDIEALADITPADCKLFLQVSPVDGAGNSGTFRYRSSVNGGVLTDSTKNVVSHAIKAGGNPENDGAGDVANVNNDIVELRQQGGNLSIVVYRNGEAAEEVLGTFKYDYSVATNKRLRFAMSFQGAKATTSIEDLRVNFDPFLDIPFRDFDQGVEVGAGLPPPQKQQRIAAATFEITFPNSDVRDFLGFNNRVNQRSLLNEAIIRGDSLFTANIMNDSYLFELLNIDLESYDSFSNGKRNILKVIPAASTNADSIVDYETNNLTFIDIRNKYPLTLRNLKARILRNDLEPIVVRGVSVVTLLIRSKGESM